MYISKGRVTLSGNMNYQRIKEQILKFIEVLNFETTKQARLFEYTCIFNEVTKTPQN